MCGIAGISGGSTESREDFLKKAIISLQQRGPDDHGFWNDDQHTVGLANTRLAVIDLLNGKQPVKIDQGALVGVLNGEIYNYRELRQRLQSLGYQFSTESDTEVFIRAYDHFGPSCLSYVRGMFACAIYNRERKELFLARDHFGIKPLYYSHQQNLLLFASEIKALLNHSSIKPSLSHEALEEFLIFGYPSGSRTFFDQIQELQPGHYLIQQGNSVVIREYCSWQQNHAQQKPPGKTAAKQALLESLQDHLISDVPIGSFLSGGVDSATIVALMVRELGIKPDTFTFRIDDPEYDESIYARAYSEILETNHHEIEIPRNRTDLDLIYSVLNYFDQPFGDSSAIPTYLVCEEMRKHFKVVLSGDGGDEMFGGYPRFFHADLAQRFGRIPHILRTGLKSTIQKFTQRPHLQRKTERFFRAANAKNKDRLHMFSCYQYPEEIHHILRSDAIPELFYLHQGGEQKDPGGMEFRDFCIQRNLSYDYLKKVDMMSGVHGLEVRVPFLGSQVKEMAMQLPRSSLYNWKERKILLKSIASDYLPRELFTQPKRGLNIPLDFWLKKSARKEIQNHLCSPSAPLDQYIHRPFREHITQLFVNEFAEAHQNTRFTLSQTIFSLLALNTWCEKFNPIENSFEKKSYRENDQEQYAGNNFYASGY